MAYDRLLAAGFYFLFVLLSTLSMWQNVSMRGARRASSFAILGLRVGFVRIANVLDLVRWLGTNLILSVLCFISLVATLLSVVAKIISRVAIKLSVFGTFMLKVANRSTLFATFLSVFAILPEAFATLLVVFAKSLVVIA